MFLMVCGSCSDGHGLKGYDASLEACRSNEVKMELKP